jgi:hypothetical protein
MSPPVRSFALTTMSGFACTRSLQLNGPRRPRPANTSSNIMGRPDQDDAGSVVAEVDIREGLFRMVFIKTCW